MKHVLTSHMHSVLPKVITGLGVHLAYTVEFASVYFNLSLQPNVFPVSSVFILFYISCVSNYSYVFIAV